MALTTLQPIIDQVQPLTDAVAAAEALIVKFANDVKAAPTLAEAQSVADLYLAQKTKLSDAVVANTPADPQNPNPPESFSRRK